MISGYAQNAKAETPVPATLNERLNRVAEGLMIQCERIESVLSRVNGTPTNEKAGRDVAQIRPLHALASLVDNLEGIQQRLGELSNGIERIA